MPSVEYDIFYERINRYQFRLVDCAATLHESVSGVTDCLHPREALKIYGFLSCRLNDWYPSVCLDGKFREYDEAVREICRIAMREYEKKDLDSDLIWICKGVVDCGKKRDAEKRCSLCEYEFTKEDPQFVGEGYTIDKHLGYSLHNHCMNKLLEFNNNNQQFSTIEAFDALKHIILTDVDFKESSSSGGNIMPSGLIVPSGEWLQNLQNKIRNDYAFDNSDPSKTLNCPSVFVTAEKRNM
jgi:hypothetical protein